MSKYHVGGVALDSPLLLASGYITETPEFFLRSHAHGCGGIVTRSLKRHVPPERQRVPVPRYAIHEHESMLNVEWGNERPWTDWRDGGVDTVKKTGAPIILSLSGRDPEGCASLMAEFDPLGVDAYEINVSCSHSGALHGNLNIDQDHVVRLLKTVRPATKTPIWIKLSYSTQLIPMALLAEQHGADAIVCTNSIGPGMLIDTNSGQPQVGIEGGGGGLTGLAIFPIALWCVHQLARNVSIPIIGSGGVSTGDHAVQMFMAGASAIELYTAPALIGPRSFRKVEHGIELFLRGHPEYGSVTDLVGVTKRHTKEHRFESPVPTVIADKCTGCRLCVPSCAFNAIEMVSRPQQPDLAVITDACTSCNACVGACPSRFGAIVANFAEVTNG